MGSVERGHIDDYEGGLSITYNEIDMHFEMDEVGGLYCRGNLCSRLVVEDDGGLYLNPTDNEHGG